MAHTTTRIVPLRDLIPDDILTQVHIDRVAAGCIRSEESARQIIELVVMTGGKLSEARGWAICTALMRDATLTDAEKRARDDARAQYEASRHVRGLRRPLSVTTRLEAAL